MVEVMEPMGDFILSENNISPQTHIVLWGAGSGITPLISIAKYSLHKNIVRHVTLVYGNRNEDSVIFFDKIEEFKKNNENFSAFHFYTQSVISPSNPDVIQGRIDPDKVLSVMLAEGNINNTVHYICGPIGLKESVKAALINLDIDTDKIYIEDFEIVRNPADFDNIKTRVVLIKNNGKYTDVEVVKGKSILEAGLDAMIDLSYSCQTGNCLVCKGRLIKGDIKMIGVKNPKGLKADEYLLCSSFPLSDNVEIEVE
jgi:ring-1,2-phenylacetyl-CoA epoxidase subunit PaaE